MKTLKHGKWKRTFVTLGLSLLFSVFAFLFAAVAAEDSGVSMGIVYGYRNTAKSGQLLPVTVSFENVSGERVDGFLSLEVPGESGSISYTSAVKIPEGSHSEKRTVTIPDALTQSEGSILRAVLFDDYGEEIASAETSVSYLGNGREVLCGILSDNQQNLLYLGGIGLGKDLTTKVVTLNPADMPEDEDGLNQLDVIVISSFDTGRLSDACVTAVMNWVEGGGTLIFGTGKSKNPLGEFRSRIGNPKLTYLGVRPVDMGMQYSNSGPDGAVLDLSIRTIVWDGAEVLQESFDRDNVLRKGYGKGYVCITAFDLCDLTEFCAEHPGYPQDFLTSVIGQAGISRISGSMLSAEERLKSSKELTNTYDETKIPRIVIYVILAVAFLCLAGPLLFRILTGKGLGFYYMLGVLILALFFTLVIWLQASSTRVTSPYIQYGVINEFRQTGDGNYDVAMKGFINMGSPNRGAMTLELPSECTVRPVITSGNISITTGKRIMLAVAGQNQFETNTFQVEEKIGQVEKECPLDVSLQTDEDGLTGTVKNSGETRFTGLTLLYSGEIYYLGDLEPGEETSLKEHTPVFGPVTNADMAAEYISGRNEDKLCKLQKERLCAYCLRENTALSEGKGLLLGIADNYDPAFLLDTEYTITGNALFAVEAETVQTEGTDRFRRKISTSPKVLSGSYDAADNTIQGHGTTVLEYSLGSGFALSALELVPLSTELDGKYVTAFSGQTALYNYVTASYDLTDAGKMVWTAEELAPYLSPGNNLTVRFIPDEETRDDVPVFLPIPYIRGTLVSQTPGAETPEN